jgi:hypothetical protein
VRFFYGFYAAIVLAVMIPVFGIASATTVYIAQTAVGSANGSSCTNAYAVTFFNTSSNWGLGGSQIGPGTTVNLCGTLTTELTAHGSGSSGSPITISFQSTAAISLPACDNTNGCLNIDGLSYIIVDGGTPCGPGTACNFNLSGTGVIQNTQNGSALMYQQSVFGITAASSGCSNCEVKNLLIYNLYQHTSSTDVTNFGATASIAFAGCSGCITKIHDLTIHDSTAGVQYVPGSSDNGLQIYSTDIYNVVGGINLATSKSSNTMTGAAIHDNHIHDLSNWSTTTCYYHIDGIHAWGLTNGVISGVSFYNNLMDGNYGSCPTGTVFFEGYTHDDLFYNNVFVPTYTQEAAGIVGINGFNDQFYNNVVLGQAKAGDQCVNFGYSPDSWTPYTPSMRGENNIIENCGTLMNFNSNPTLALTAWNYNAYGQLPSGGTVVYNGTWYYSLASWQSYCSCDSHSVIPSSGITASLGLNMSGTPQLGSPVINAGTNLMSLGITVLDSSTSAGNTVTPMARPATGAWTIGAGNYYIVPPTALNVVPQ